MAFPTFAVETSLTTDPLDTPSWEAQTSYVKGLAFKRGRDQALEGMFPPATATVVLDNPDRRFDPEHASGPHYGDLLPGKRLRIKATWDAVTYDLFGGFVDGWPQTYRGQASADCVVTATDGFTMLNRAELAASPLESVIESLAPVHWWKLDDATGSPVVHDYGTGDTDGAAMGVAQDGLGADGLDPGSTATSLSLNAAGYVDVSGCDEDWTSLACLVRIDDATTDGVLWQSASRSLSVNIYGDRTVTASDTGARQDTGSVLTVAAAHMIVAVRTGAGAFTVYVDGASQSLSGGGPDANPGSTVVGSSNDPHGSVALKGDIQHVATFADQLTADDAANLYEASLGQFDGDTTDERLDRILDLGGWPTADRDLDTGTVTLGALTETQWTDSVLDNARLIEATEAGAFYQEPDYTMRFRNRYDHLTATRSTASQYTFSDDPAESLHYEDLGFPEQSTYLYNRVKVTWSGGEVVVTDQTSITAHGPREHSVTTILPTAAQARALGEWIIDHYSDPVIRIDRIELNPGADERLWTPCLDLRVGDRVTVERHPQQVGATIAVEVIVEGITARVDDGIGMAKFTLSVSAADTAEFWTWGTSTWGETTRWA